MVRYNYYHMEVHVFFLFLFFAVFLIASLFVISTFFQLYLTTTTTKWSLNTKKMVKILFFPPKLSHFYSLFYLFFNFFVASSKKKNIGSENSNRLHFKLE